MVLHILRHAEAEDSAPGGDDADRKLTDAGQKRMRLVGRAIAKTLEPSYDVILVSPLVRARQTAEPVADACGFSRELRETDALLPNAAPDAVLGELGKLEAETVLVVGHEPHVGRLFGRLLAGDDRLEVPMKKASLAAFEADGEPSSASWELKLYLPARILERLA
ncbi:MAG TPA: phosphohistidine phosphatase SixA [Thermoanaerobaculia bacterium]|nr:phosphohistidine phosphatase SixA [Thermoanaerobaculia bacterium]